MEYLLYGFNIQIAPKKILECAWEASTSNRPTSVIDLINRAEIALHKHHMPQWKIAFFETLNERQKEGTAGMPYDAAAEPFGVLWRDGHPEPAANITQ